MQTNVGRKDDASKLRLDLIPPEAILALGAVMTHGAVKYGANTWRGIENPIARYEAALLRHLMAWKMGENYDADSGLPHLHHVLTNAAFLVALNAKGE